MIGELFNSPITFLLWALGLTTAITIHEFAHAYTADRLGDPTPRLQGRLTLNPLKHLDFFGTLMLLVARFGWGKPVQFDPFNLRNPRRDSMIISLAGPVSNGILAIICALLIRIFLNNPIIYVLLQPIIVLNVMLGIFNLVPIHPLDGFKIVEGLLPDEYARQWHQLENYGMIFLLFLAFPILTRVSPISQIISPIISFLIQLLIPGVKTT